VWTEYGIVPFAHFTCQFRRRLESPLRKINNLGHERGSGIRQKGLFLASVLLVRNSLGVESDGFPKSGLIWPAPFVWNLWLGNGGASLFAFNFPRFV
jgi:hypothetical protein